MKKPNKTAIETVKTVTIAILVTAIIAFISGVAYANKQRSQVDQTINALTTTKVEASPSK